MLCILQSYIILLVVSSVDVKALPEVVKCCRMGIVSSASFMEVNFGASSAENEISQRHYRSHVLVPSSRSKSISILSHTPTFNIEEQLEQQLEDMSSWSPVANPGPYHVLA